MTNHAALRELAELLKLEVEIYGPRIPESPRSLMLTAAEALRAAASEGGEAVAILVRPHPPGAGVIPRSKTPSGATTITPNENALSLPPGTYALYTQPPEVARDAVDALRAEVTSLRLFANEIMNDWWEGDLDGGSRQDIAERHGLIAGFEVTEACGELCNCAELGEWPTQCFRRTPLLTGKTESKAAISGAAGEKS